MGRRMRIWILIVGVMVFLTYLYLARQDTPELSLSTLLTSTGKLVLFFVPGMLGSIPGSVWLVYEDVFWFLIVFIFVAAFFIQFAIPVRSISKRMRAVFQLFLYMIGLHGPLTSIENGQALNQRTNSRMKGWGALRLDSASGALLRKKSAFTRSVGPGLVFTKWDEYLAGTVDLHDTTWPIPPLGPLENEDPFSGWDEYHETPEDYEARFGRRKSTSGITRDGLEVVPNIYAVSHLEYGLPAEQLTSPGIGFFKSWRRKLEPDHQTKFGYYPEAVRLAVSGETLENLNHNRGIRYRHLPWYQLPAFLAVELWREYLRKFSFDQLFKPLDEESGDTAMLLIREYVQARLTQSEVVEIDAYGKPTGNIVESPEYDLLQRRGIKVISVVIQSLRFHEGVERQVEEHWFANWLDRAEAERLRIAGLRDFQRKLGSRDARRIFAYQAARQFNQQFLNLPQPQTNPDRLQQMKRSLEWMLLGTLSRCLNDPELSALLIDEDTKLTQLIEWVRR